MPHMPLIRCVARHCASFRPRTSGAHQIQCSADHFRSQLLPGPPLWYGHRLFQRRLPVASLVSRDAHLIMIGSEQSALTGQARPVHKVQRGNSLFLLFGSCVSLLDARSALASTFRAQVPATAFLSLCHVPVHLGQYRRPTRCTEYFNAGARFRAALLHPRIAATISSAVCGTWSVCVSVASSSRHRTRQKWVFDASILASFP